MRATEALLDRFLHKIRDAVDEKASLAGIEADPALLGPAPDAQAARLLAAFEARGGRSVFVRYLRTLGDRVTADAVLAAIALTLAWGPLQRRRISRRTAVNLPWHLALYGTLLGAAIPGRRHAADSLCGVPMGEILASWSATELAGLALTGRRPSREELLPYQVLLGLLLSNGPGTISAQGAKGAVSADGPETPERVQLNKAMVGFLTHTGFSHGGNGFEGMQLLLDQFAGREPDDPGKAGPSLDLAAMARDFARAYRQEKVQRRETAAEGARAIPGVNHPVFRGKPVNHDPRESFVAGLMAERGERNLFHDYYRALVQAMFDEGVTSNVFCVNVDGVIAAWLLKLLWQPFRSGEIGREDLETAAFTIFLLARMAGSAAEIEDHLNRGRNMDTRTAASACRHVV